MDNIRARRESQPFNLLDYHRYRRLDSLRRLNPQDWRVAENAELLSCWDLFRQQRPEVFNRFERRYRLVLLHAVWDEVRDSLVHLPVTLALAALLLSGVMAVLYAIVAILGS